MTAPPSAGSTFLAGTPRTSAVRASGLSCQTSSCACCGKRETTKLPTFSTPVTHAVEGQPRPSSVATSISVRTSAWYPPIRLGVIRRINPESVTADTVLSVRRRSRSFSSALSHSSSRSALAFSTRVSRSVVEMSSEIGGRSVALLMRISFLRFGERWRNYRDRNFCSMSAVMAEIFTLFRRICFSRPAAGVARVYAEGFPLLLGGAGRRGFGVLPGRGFSAPVRCFGPLLPAVQPLLVGLAHGVQRPGAEEVPQRRAGGVDDVEQGLDGVLGVARGDARRRCPHGLDRLGVGVPGLGPHRGAAPPVGPVGARFQQGDVDAEGR